MYCSVHIRAAHPHATLVFLLAAQLRHQRCSCICSLVGHILALLGTPEGEDGCTGVGSNREARLLHALSCSARSPLRGRASPT